MQRSSITILLLFLFFYSNSYSQEYFNQYQNTLFPHYDRYLYNSDLRFHTSVKPYLYSQYDTIVDIDSLYAFNPKRKIWKIAFDRSFIRYNKMKMFNFTIDPLVHFEFGKDPDNQDLSSINTRGILINATMNKKISISTSFYENQAFFNDYRKTIVQDLGVIPGQGRPKGYKDDGYDYGIAEGYLSVSPSKNFNFQLGTGRNFFGDGYRSLLLSDNALNYPFFKITTDFWHVKYVNLWAQFQDFNQRSSYEMGYDKKWGAFHYLDWSVTKWFNFAFFEAIIWQNADSTGYRGFDFTYANPVIFYRPVEFTNGSPDNALMGLNMKLTLWKKNVIYGQILLDEFKLDEIKAGNGWWANKYGIQGGFKTFDIFKLKHLDFQTEVNYVRPFTYSHRSSVQNYGHQNQSLAHPMGSNFIESITFVKYSWKRLFFEARVSYALHGRDTAGLNYGNDIFKPYGTYAQEYGNEIGQAEEVYVLFSSLSLAYIVNPATNLNIFVQYSNRKETSASINKDQNLILFGLRTSLNNYYYDY